MTLKRRSDGLTANFSIFRLRVNCKCISVLFVINIRRLCNLGGRFCANTYAVINAICPMASPVIARLSTSSLPNLLSVGPRSFRPLFILRNVLSNVFCQGLCRRKEGCFLIGVSNDVCKYKRCGTVSRYFAFRISGHVSGIRFLNRNGTRLFNRFRITPRRLCRPARVSNLLVNMISRLAIRGIGGRVKKGPIASVLRARDNGRVLAFRLRRRALSLIMRMGGGGRPRGASTNGRPRMGHLVRHRCFVLFLLSGGFLLRRHNILAMFRVGFDYARFGALVAYEVVGALVFRLVVVNLFRVPRLFGVVLRMAIASVLRVQFRVVELCDLERAFAYWERIVLLRNGFGRLNVRVVRDHLVFSEAGGVATGIWVMYNEVGLVRR